jgi:hypothetical protein
MLCHSSSSATPGITASSGSPRYWLTKRCMRNTSPRCLRPTSAAVISFGRGRIWRRIRPEYDARQWRAADPVEVQRGDRFEADMHRAVDRRAGRCEDADDAEGLVAVFRSEFAEAVIERDVVVQPVAEALRHLAAEHGLEDPGERLALAKAQFLRSP